MNIRNIFSCISNAICPSSSKWHRALNSAFHSISHVCGGALFISALALSSCSETDYLSYDPSANGVYFHRDTLTYSFSVMPVDSQTHVLQIPVKIMGVISDVPRTFAYRIERQMPSDSIQKLIYLPESESYVWAEEGKQYDIPGQVTIPAGKIEGSIPVTIHRNALAGSFAEGYQHYRLVIRLSQNENFTPVLTEKDQVRIIEFDNAIDQPAWYDAFGGKVWYERELGVWHPYKFIKMVEYFHDIKNILPDTYKKMEALYGENLENVPYGDFHMYKTIFRKHIYARMYEHFNDPANRDMILSLYPDFPFDFPNPF